MPPDSRSRRRVDAGRIGPQPCGAYRRRHDLARSSAGRRMLPVLRDTRRESPSVDTALCGVGGIGKKSKISRVQRGLPVRESRACFDTTSCSTQWPGRRSAQLVVLPASSRPGGAEKNRRYRVPRARADAAISRCAAYPEASARSGPSIDTVRCGSQLFARRAVRPLSNAVATNPSQSRSKDPLGA